MPVEEKAQHHSNSDPESTAGMVVRDTDRGASETSSAMTANNSSELFVDTTSRLFDDVSADVVAEKKKDEPKDINNEKRPPSSDHGNNHHNNYNHRRTMTTSNDHNQLPQRLRAMATHVIPKPLRKHREDETAAHETSELPSLAEGVVDHKRSADHGTEATTTMADPEAESSSGPSTPPRQHRFRAMAAAATNVIPKQLRKHRDEELSSTVSVIDAAVRSSTTTVSSQESSSSATTAVAVVAEDGLEATPLPTGVGGGEADVTEEKDSTTNIVMPVNSSGGLDVSMAPPPKQHRLRAIAAAATNAIPKPLRKNREGEPSDTSTITASFSGMNDLSKADTLDKGNSSGHGDDGDGAPHMVANIATLDTTGEGRHNDAGGVASVPHRPHRLRAIATAAATHVIPKQLRKHKDEDPTEVRQSSSSLSDAAEGDGIKKESSTNDTEHAEVEDGVSEKRPMQLLRGNRSKSDQTTPAARQAFNLMKKRSSMINIRSSGLNKLLSSNTTETESPAMTQGENDEQSAPMGLSTAQDEQLPQASSMEDQNDEQSLGKGNANLVINVDEFWGETTKFWALVAFTAISIPPTMQNWERIQRNQIPASVAVCWTLLAYMCGGVFFLPDFLVRYFQRRSSTSIALDRQMNALSNIEMTSSDDEFNVGDDTDPQNAGSSRVKKFLSNPIRKALSRVPGAPRRLRPHLPRQQSFNPRISWTHLNKNSDGYRPWRNSVDPLQDHENRLIKRLLQNKGLRRLKRRHTVNSLTEGTNDSAVPSLDPVAETKPADTGSAESPVENDKNDGAALGEFDLQYGETLDDYMLAPLLKLRGMDIFMSEDPDQDIATHPWFVKNGLRDLPTLICNMVTQWGNVLIYFEMPEWVKDLDAIVEADDDPDDVRAFKRFLNGSEDYRNQRLKVVPSLVDGPTAVKLLAPPKKERVIHGTVIPLSWYAHNVSATTEGKRLCPVIECELDCFNGRAIRGMANIVKRHLKKLSLDLGIVITAPTGKKASEEPQACLGLFRFDHIDIEACPPLPMREDCKDEDPDIQRASSIMGVSVSEME